MKKLLCLLVLSAFVAGGSLFAQKGGFVDPAKGGGKGGFRQTGESFLNNSRLFAVRQQPDGEIVLVTGWLIEHLDDDTYLFKELDSSDTIVVEVDEDKWRGLTVTPEDKVILIGEVDRDGDKVKIDVKRIRKAEGNKQGEAGAKGDKPAAAGCTRCGSDGNEREVARIFVSETLEAPLMQYRINVGEYPTTEQGLAALLKAPSEHAANWRGPYIKNLPTDPWGNPYQYRFPGIRNPRSYDLWSYGPDGVGSGDDINNWSASQTD